MDMGKGRGEVSGQGRGDVGGEKVRKGQLFLEETRREKEGGEVERGGGDMKQRNFCCTKFRSRRPTRGGGVATGNPSK